MHYPDLRPGVCQGALEHITVPNKKLNLSIAVTSRGRAAIAAHVAVSFYIHFRLPSKSQLTIAMGYGDSELGGTSTPIVVHKKKCHFGFGNPAGLARMAFLGRGCYKKKSQR